MSRFFKQFAGVVTGIFINLKEKVIYFVSLFEVIYYKPLGSFRTEDIADFHNNKIHLK